MNPPGLDNFLMFAQSNDGSLVATPLQATDGGALTVTLVNGGSPATPISTLEMNSDTNFLSTEEGIVIAGGIYGYSDGAGHWIRARVLTPADGLANPAIDDSLSQTSFSMGYIGGAAWSRIRSANVFKTVVATAAGNTAVWTPAAGKKFNLMGYQISVSGVLAATATQVIELLDGATIIKNHLATVVSGTVSGDTQIGVSLGTNGQLSAAANNVLNINLSSAMTGGGVAINVWGTEE